MSKIKAKAIIAVEIPVPNSTVKADKKSQRNAELRNYVEDSILVALEGLSPKVQRLNLSRDKEGNND